MLNGRETYEKKLKYSVMLQVDFTRTSESVQKRGVDLKAIMERDKMKTDLSALFMPRQVIKKQNLLD